MSETNRILVVGPAWVGDMVMAQALFMQLKLALPDRVVDVLAPAWAKPLLARMPEVAETLDAPFQLDDWALGKRWQLGKALRNRYLQAVVLPHAWKLALVPYAAKIPQRTGWSDAAGFGLLNDVRRLDKAALPMAVQRFVSLALPSQAQFPDRIPKPKLQVPVAQVQQALAALSLEKRARRPILALCPGAESGPARRWPEEFFGTLAQAYQKLGWEVWLFGSAQDQEVCALVEKYAEGGCRNLAGATTLEQAIDLLSLAEAVVTNDSGLMHVAAALDRPVVALYGSTDPKYAPPLTDKSKILSLGLDCSPCNQGDCPLGHTDCLYKLPLTKVIDAVESLVVGR